MGVAIYKIVRRRNFPNGNEFFNFCRQPNILPIFPLQINQVETTHPKNRAETTHLWNWTETTRPNLTEMTHPRNRTETTRAETTWPNGNRTETTRIPTFEIQVRT